MTNGAGWRSRLMSDYWFANLPAALQDNLLDAARQRRKTPGKLLFAKGDPPCGLYALLEGSLRVGGVDEQRLAPRLEVVKTPFWFGEVSLFDGLPRRFDIYSLEQSIFLHVPQALILEWLEHNRAWWRPFAELLGEKLELPMLPLDQLKLLPDKAQVARRLLLLAEGYGHLSHARRLITLDEIQSTPALQLSSSALLDIVQDLHERKIVRLGADQLEVFDVLKLRKVANLKRVKSLC